MGRPSVDVVVPFLGTPAELDQLLDRLARLRLRPGDRVLVVDNTPGRTPPPRDRPGATVVAAAEKATAGYARNRGVARGRAEWLVFFDADTTPGAQLLDLYFDPPPEPSTALLAGGVLDEEVPERAPAVARYAHLRRAMSQDNTLAFGEWGFAKTANLACRREAFEAVGGFHEHVRAAEDADLVYRLRAAGWGLERREGAAVVHHSRRSVRRLVAQRLRWGAGAAWLAREYPGAFPARRLPGLSWWGLRTAAAGLASAYRSRDRDAAVVAVIQPLEELAYEVGRAFPNERPLPKSAPWRWLS